MNYFPSKYSYGGREKSNMMYGVFAVIEDASAFITITLLFNFSRFIPNSKTAYRRLMKIKINTKQKNNLLTNLPKGNIL